MKPILYITEELKQKLETLDQAMLDSKGFEWHNPVPIAVHSGLKRPLTLQQQIQRLVRTALSQQVASQGMETFEEANDFEVGDDFESDPQSPYQAMVDDYLTNAVSNRPNTTDPASVPAPDTNPQSVASDPVSSSSEPPQVE